MDMVAATVNGIPFVSRSKQNIKIGAEGLFDGTRIVLAQAAQLRAGAVEAGVYEERGLTTGFGYKITKF